MQLILRNFITILKRFKTASILNVLGLSTAFAAFLIILMQVRYEQSFDKFHSKAERIYRLEAQDEEAGRTLYACILSRPQIEEFAASSPHIAAGALTENQNEVYLTVEQGDHPTGMREQMVLCTPELAQIFDFAMLEGDTTALRTPDQVLIPQSMARRMFGHRPAYGAQITYGSERLTVGGVYRDFPRNTQIHNALYRNMGKRFANQRGMWAFKGYILLDRAANKQQVVDNYMKNYVAPHPDQRQKDYRLTLLSDVYYTNDSEDMTPQTHGDKAQTRLLLIVAFLVIAIAAINFINFTTALAPMRIKSINTQKVLGCSTGILRAGLIFEAVGLRP